MVERNLPLLFRQPAFGVVSPILDHQEIPEQLLLPPESMEIPSLNLSIPIKPASVIGNNWDTYDNAVSWLTSSALPGMEGNMVMYGHNTDKIFGKLHLLKNGDEIIIKTVGQEYRYQIFESREVSPKFLNYVKDHGNRLTLYTCSGIFDSKRLFILASPIATSPALMND